MKLSHSQFEQARPAAASRDAETAAPGAVGAALPLVIAGGFAGALASWFVPIGLIETVVESIGLSEIIGAFAAPLGLKARLLIALVAAIGCALAAALSLGLFSRGSSAAPKPAPRPEGPRRETEYEGDSEMTRLAPNTDYQEWPPRQSSGLFDRLREGLSRFPAPRRYDDGGGEPPLRDFSELKTLRPGGERGEAERPPQPIAAHAELGEPLPPVQPVRVRTHSKPDLSPRPQPLTVGQRDRGGEARESYRPADNPFMPQPVARDAPRRQAVIAGPRDDWSEPPVPQVPPPHEEDDEPESIAVLTDRLARALGREAERGGQGAFPRPTHDADVNADAARAEAETRRRAESEAAKQAAREALKEAEQAAEQALRRAEDARHRLAAIEAGEAAPGQGEQPVRSAGPGMDPALRDALRTLRRMTAQK